MNQSKNQRQRLMNTHIPTSSQFTQVRATLLRPQLSFTGRGNLHQRYQPRGEVQTVAIPRRQHSYKSMVQVRPQNYHRQDRYTPQMANGAIYDNVDNGDNYECMSEELGGEEQDIYEAESIQEGEEQSQF